MKGDKKLDQAALKILSNWTTGTHEKYLCTTWSIKRFSKSMLRKFITYIKKYIKGKRHFLKILVEIPYIISKSNLCKIFFVLKWSLNFFKEITSEKA